MNLLQNQDAGVNGIGNIRGLPYKASKPTICVIFQCLKLPTLKQHVIKLVCNFLVKLAGVRNDNLSKFIYLNYQYSYHRLIKPNYVLLYCSNSKLQAH